MNEELETDFEDDDELECEVIEPKGPEQTMSEDDEQE